MLLSHVAGVDPGASGAFVRLSRRYGTFCIWSIRFAKFNWGEIADAIRDEGNDKGLVAALEHVHAFRKDDVKTANTFGKNTGRIEGILYSHHIPFELVDPKEWQMEFNLGGRYKDQATRKRAHQEKARELFPDIAVTLDLADALLIALYKWRKTYGGLTHGKNKVERKGAGIIWSGI